MDGRNGATDEETRRARRNRNERFMVRVRTRERDAWRQAADAEGVSVSEWVRETLGRAARRAAK